MRRPPRAAAATGRRKVRTPPRTPDRLPSRKASPDRRRRGTGGQVGRRDQVAQAESLRKDVERLARGSGPARWNANPDDVQRSVVKLVLTIVEFLRQLLERQAIRRMEAGTISAEETEAIGVALMRLEETVRDLGARFNLTAEDLNLDLGPVGRLL
jgi:Gas vesicle protein K